MDEGTRLLSARDREAAGAGGPDAADDSARLELEVDASRARLGDLVGELERRGRAARAPALVVVAAVGIAAIVGGVVWVRWRRRSHPRLLREMWRRAVAHPERVAAERPNVAKKILGAAGSAAAAAGARAVMKRWLGSSRP